MKKMLGVVGIVMFLVMPALVFAGELDSFISSINVQAKADLPGFKAKMSAQFGVPAPEIDLLFRSVPTPGDVYMTLRVGQIANKPSDVVLREYKANKGKGWGVIAKNMGIKPGSKEFHDLKKGDFGPGPDSGKGKGKGKGKDKDSGGISIDIFGGGGKGKGPKR
ncbi:MAG: hypothetical protein L0Y62_08085 [Nitrospirae bacterium]|nr:hypothetical protein [Nitrospirota bacterium]